MLIEITVYYIDGNDGTDIGFQQLPSTNNPIFWDVK